MLEVKVFDEEVLGVRLLETQSAEVQTLDDQRSRNVFVLWMMFNDARGVASEPLSWWASMGHPPGCVQITYGLRPPFASNCQAAGQETAATEQNPSIGSSSCGSRPPVSLNALNPTARDTPVRSIQSQHTLKPLV
jgi:hypothetical protein